MAEMKLACIMGVVAVFLATFVYGHVLSVRLAVLIFLLFASCLFFLGLHLAELRRRK